MKWAPANESSVLKQNLAVRQQAVDKHAVLRLKAVTDLSFVLSCGASVRLRAMYSPFDVSRSLDHSTD
jgi:hypothetical protein